MAEQVLTLNGVIDSYGWFRYQVESFLEKNKDVPVRIKIDSYGGSVEAALAVSRLLDAHGKVTVEFMGFVASAATWMAFGASRIEMHEDTLWLCHKCSVPVSEWGYKKAEELDQLIKELEKQKKTAEAIDLTIARKYLERCAPSGKTLMDVLRLMEEERYMDSPECLSWGFVDAVIPGMNRSDRDAISNFADVMHFPPVPRAGTFQKEGRKEAEGSLVSRFLSAFSSVFSEFSEKREEGKTAAGAEDDAPIHTQDNTMKEDFKSVNALLGVAGLPVEDGKVALTEEQAGVVDRALSACKDAEEALDSISGHVKSINGIANKVNALKLLVDRIPTGIPGSSSNAETESRKDALDTKDMNDPVNDYARHELNRKNKN